MYAQSQPKEKPRLLTVDRQCVDTKLSVAVFERDRDVSKGEINAWGDRRMAERTYAWLRAVGTLQLLLVQLAVLQLPQNAWMQQLFPGPNPTADVWNRVADAAEQGYYSVWVNVFKRFGVANPGPGNNNLASDLVTLLNNRVAVNTPFRYRGTNLQNSVIAQLPNL